MVHKQNEIILKYFKKSEISEDAYESFIFLWIAFSSYLLSYYAKFTDSPSQALENFSKEGKFVKLYQNVAKDVNVESFEEFLRYHYDDSFIGVLDLKYAQMFHDFIFEIRKVENLEEDFNKRHYKLKFHKIGVLLDEKGMSFYNYLMLIYQMRCNIFHKGSVSGGLTKKLKDKEEKLVWLGYMSFKKFCSELFLLEGIITQ